MVSLTLTSAFPELAPCFKASLTFVNPDVRALSFDEIIIISFHIINLD
ncbi:hypothetical protein YpsIP31758_B0131 (plasmid) [Yersinia pseudotuberculosis IP 31758]|uniref:Uncharacterized protein n=1 Tax=Yersinia pseudotuberculosis serotype O:1b (strain IP 31758) TaxID=349747 RepID=A0A0U1QTP0_YERP3|nr:hypothetical protein YpsIP31758_B0131 [Yersinia pseudotuberculosis IP 31758]